MASRTKNVRYSRFTLQSCRKHIVPVLVWLVAASCVAMLAHRRAQKFQTVGIARGRVAQVASSATGRITEVRVKLYQQVKAGQTVAVVDTIRDNELQPQLVQARIATIEAEIARLNAQLKPTEESLLADQTDRENSHVAAMRNFDTDVESTRLKILGIRAQLASDQMTLGELAANIKILSDLVAKDAIAPYELEKAKAQHEALGKKITENEAMLDQAKADLKDATDRREAYAKAQLVNPNIDQALDVIRKGIDVQQKTLDELNAQRLPIELKAPIDGVVVPISTEANGRMPKKSNTGLLRTTGEVVSAGDPIVAICQEKPDEVVTYVDQGTFDKVRENMRVQLVTRRDPDHQVASTQVLSVSPTVELLPERLWRNPNIPQWGRPVVIAVPTGMNLIAGEAVGIKGL